MPSEKCLELGSKRLSEHGAEQGEPSADALNASNKLSEQSRGSRKRVKREPTPNPVRTPDSCFIKLHEAKLERKVSPPNEEAYDDEDAAILQKLGRLSLEMDETNASFKDSLGSVQATHEHTQPSRSESRGLSANGSCPRSRRTKVTIRTYIARIRKSGSSIEDLIVQARKTSYDVIDLAEMRRHRPFNAVYNTEEELLHGICNSRVFGGVSILVNTSFSMNIDSLERPTTPIGRLRLKRCRSIPALTIFVVYAPSSNYDEEVKAFYMDLEKFNREDHKFFKVTIGDVNANIGLRKMSEERHIGTHGLELNEQGELLPEFIMATKNIHGNLQFQKEGFT
ncbi:unnamed protein product [Angiostrongylus costaricensis]|uniref:Craniofacial development protein 2-like n=1 Tax=Angiostrongylus costaricensis TaxID=334426 RepID=A0A0R3Q262_ANGCS|nr:unnamed protein product [Angiostrongylus costaricensis]